MKLVLSAPNDTTLQLTLCDPALPITKQLPLNPAQITSLRQCVTTYQTLLAQATNHDALKQWGLQLFQLLNQQADLIGKWLNAVGARSLEIQAALNPTPFQHLLLNLPWEIMADQQQFLAADVMVYEVVRRIGHATPATPNARYNDLTLVFMAADPDFSGGLQYEAEERAILQATRNANNLNLWVEESGNLNRLTQRIVESGHCDMVHISCHGGYDPQHGFVLQLEDDYYRPQPVTAHDFQNLAPHIQCLFLSACHSAEMTDAPAFALQLCKMGIANVIGWNGSVADDDATAFAAIVYNALLQQASVPYACGIARQRLLQQHLYAQKNAQPQQHAHWHLGRVYLAPHGGLPLLDTQKTSSPKRRGKPCHELLDKKKKVVPVASRETFVGRRKQTKDALNALAKRSAAGILLTGMGGTGKSSLAARIVQRLEPRYKAVIIYQDYSEAAILSELKPFFTGDNRHDIFQRYLADIQYRPHYFADNLIEILQTQLAEQPIILIVDDLEQYALETLQTATMANKTPVKPQYQQALAGLITAFARADTQSHLLLTSRYPFCVLDEYGHDKTNDLLEMPVPDMNLIEQEKHWLALLQTGIVKGVRNAAQDQGFLKQIWAICQGNSGLQDVLYQPLLKGEYAVLQKALDKLQAYRADQARMVTPPAMDNVDKYLQRIALETYHTALTDTERQYLRVLSLFEFAIPEILMLQAGEQLGIHDPQTALQHLANLGLLNHWQGEGLDGHIARYGLAQKIVAPLTQLDRHFIASICAPLLWQIWFAEFLQAYKIDTSKTLKEQLVFIWQHHFPIHYSGELPLQSTQDQERIAHLHRFCIHNSLTDWEKLGFTADAFIDLFELSLSLNTFEKLRISTTTLDGLSDFQLSELWKVFTDEMAEFKKLTSTKSNVIISSMLQSFICRPDLLAKAYQLYLGEISRDDYQKLTAMEVRNAEERHLMAIQLAKTQAQQVQAYGEYAQFLADQKQDYEQAETFYLRAIDADPKHAHNLGNYANFLADQKQDYAQAEIFYLRAIEAEPKHANNLGNYANFLADQKQDYAQAEIFYLRAIEAEPKHANNLGNYANFLADQKQDYAQAGIFYLRAIDADPKHANSLGNYANFLANQKQDYAQAEIFYLRAIDADPKNARWIGNYANFLANQKQDYAQAEIFYLRAIEADPKHANSLGNYAYFLWQHKQDYAQAEIFYLRAIDADPKNARWIGNYANFLADQKQDYAQAEIFYLRAIEADPKHANNLGNYAKLLFATNRPAQAQQYLEQAESQKNLHPDLTVELAFYRYAHCEPFALPPLKQQLQAGARSLGWNLTANVQRATADQHPSPALLAAIAQVISGAQDINTLEQYPEWSTTP